MKRILVTDAGGPPGVNFISSLRYSGETMYIVGTDIDKKHLEWPDVNKAYVCPYRAEDPEYIDWLNKLIDKENIEFVHSQADASVKYLSFNRDKIKAKTFLADIETIEICQDKFLSAKIINNGLGESNTLFISNNKDIKLAGEILGYPYWMRARRGAGGRGSSKIESYDMGLHWFNYWKTRNIGWEFIAQKYLSGRDFAFQSLWNKGELIVSQARERLELIYSHLAVSRKTGTPTIAKTIHRDDINEAAIKAVKAINKNATGIFCVDLTEDEKGVPVVSELNCSRFFTTSLFFTRAGCNMPYYYIKLGYGEKLPELKQYNSVDKDIYYLRHIDCPNLLIKEGEWRANELR